MRHIPCLPVARRASLRYDFAVHISADGRRGNLGTLEAKKQQARGHLRARTKP